MITVCTESAGRTQDGLGAEVEGSAFLGLLRWEPLTETPLAYTSTTRICAGNAKYIKEDNSHWDLQVFLEWVGHPTPTLGCSAKLQDFSAAVGSEGPGQLARLQNKASLEMETQHHCPRDHTSKWESSAQNPLEGLDGHVVWSERKEAPGLESSKQV